MGDVLRADVMIRKHLLFRVSSIRRASNGAFSKMCDENYMTGLTADVYSFLSVFFLFPPKPVPIRAPSMLIRLTTFSLILRKCGLNDIFRPEVTPRNLASVRKGMLS